MSVGQFTKSAGDQIIPPPTHTHCIYYEQVDMFEHGDTNLV